MEKANLTINRHSISKCVENPLYLATGSSWTRILHRDNSAAAMPVTLSDGQPSIDGNTDILQLMVAAPELHAAVEDALGMIEKEHHTPAEKCKILKMKIALAKASNTHGQNNECIKEYRVELFKSELRIHAYQFHTNSKFIEQYQEKFGKLDPNTISKALDKLLSSVSVNNLNMIEFHGSSDLEKAMFNYVLSESPNQQALIAQ